MLNFQNHIKVSVYLKPTDMRKSFDTLAALIKEIELNPLCGKYFIFYNKKRDRLKILYWDGSGYWLFCKCLEQGSFSFPDIQSNEPMVWDIDMTELTLIIEGIELKKITRKKRFKHEIT